jgi:hypothetical protein
LLPRETDPRGSGIFGVRGAVCARLAGMIAVNIT